MAVPRSRILDLLKVQTRIFSQAYNPTGVRTGNSVLRQRLRGPAVAEYYPRRGGTMRDLFKAMKAMDPNIEMVDEDEEERTEALMLRRARGKGAPPKKKSKAESKRRKGAKGKSAAKKKINFGGGEI